MLCGRNYINTRRDMMQEPRYCWHVGSLGSPFIPLHYFSQYYGNHNQTIKVAAWFVCLQFSIGITRILSLHIILYNVKATHRQKKKEICRWRRFEATHAYDDLLILRILESNCLWHRNGFIWEIHRRTNALLEKHGCEYMIEQQFNNFASAISLRWIQELDIRTATLFTWCSFDFPLIPLCVTFFLKKKTWANNESCNQCCLFLFLFSRLYAYVEHVVNDGHLKQNVHTIANQINWWVCVWHCGGSHTSVISCLEVTHSIFGWMKSVCLHLCA